MNKWFNFALGLIFEQDHLPNLIILGVYAKKWPKCARISKQTDVTQNLIDDFFLTLIVRRSFHRKDFLVKKNAGVRGYFLEKRKLCMQNLTKERKKPPVVILQQLIFYNIFIRCLRVKIKIRSTCLVHEFSFTDIF